MKKMSRILCFFLAFTIIISGVPAIAADNVNVTASAAIVMDYDTGEILYAKDIDTMRVPASMTKIMTAYIIYQELEAGNITKDTQFTISDSVREKSRDGYNYPTSVPLVGDTIDVDTLLKLIMLPSASASCICAAENISGSEEAFVQRMNETAEDLGMTANYTNSHGAFINYVTCRSLAILIRDFITRYPDILNYTSMKSVTYNGTTYANTNKLLSTYYYEGVDGFKTGTTSAAGYCLSATGTRDGRRVITVVMNSSSTATRHTDSQKLLDYGFAEMAKRDEARENAQVTITSSGILRAGVESTITAAFSNVSEPFEGTVTMALGGKTVQTYTGTISNGTVIQAAVKPEEGDITSETTAVQVSYKLADGSTKAFTSELESSLKGAPVFGDIAFHWAEDDITALYNDGLLLGDDGMFYPENNITRAEFAVMISNMFTLNKYPIQDFQLNDIKGHWAESYIEKVAKRGIMVGFEGYFDPDDYITRQEVMTTLERLVSIGGISNISGFEDYDEIEPWATTAFAKLIYAGYLQGYPDNTLRPLENMTKAEAASLIYRIIK